MSCEYVLSVMAESAMSLLVSKQTLLDCGKNELKKTSIGKKNYNQCSERSLKGHLGYTQCLMVQGCHFKKVGK